MVELRRRGWSAWKTVPGDVDSGLAAVADSPDRIYLFARRGNEVVWNLYDRGTGPEQGWRGWQPLHPPPAAARLRRGRRPPHRPRQDPSPTAGARWSRAASGAPTARLPESVVTVTSSNGSWSRTAIASRRRALQGADPGRADADAAPRGARARRTSLACTTATVRTQAGVRLKATKRVRPGGRVRFRGRLLGKPIPAPRQAVELQAFDGGRWRVFAQPRTGSKGTLQDLLPAAPHVRAAHLPLPRPRAAGDGLPLRAGLLEGGPRPGSAPLIQAPRRAGRCT